MLVSRTTRGISLIEMMITISIFIILALMAFPMYTTWIANSQIRTATESVAEGLRLAQTEAVRRNQPVRFLLDPATGWQVQLESDDSIVREAQFAEGSAKTKITPVPATSTMLTFSGLGRRMAVNSKAPTAPLESIDIETSQSISGTRALRVMIQSTSGVRTCDPSIASSSDSRYCPPSS